MASQGKLTLRRPKTGGQVDGVVSIGETWYVEVFGSVQEAREFAAKWELELVPFTEDIEDELPQGPQGHTRH